MPRLLYNTCLFGGFFFQRTTISVLFFWCLRQIVNYNTSLKIMKLYNFTTENVNKAINAHRYLPVYWIIAFLSILSVDNGTLS